MQKLQPLCLQLVGEQIDPGKIAGWSGEAADETQSGGVFSNQKYDGNRRSGGLGGHPTSATGHNLRLLSATLVPVLPNERTYRRRWLSIDNAHSQYKFPAQGITRLRNSATRAYTGHIIYELTSCPRNARSSRS